MAARLTSGGHVDIVVKGRNVEVPEHFRVHVSEKLARTERYDPKMARVDVELSHESNPRQAKNKQRVQITVTGRGPAVRAEAAAESFYAALDLAADKLDTRLRKARGRRLDRVTSRAPLAAVTAGAVPGGPEPLTGTWGGESGGLGGPEQDGDAGSYGGDDDTGPGRIVRIKDHPAEPITVDQALFQMELVGHDFYLFNDAESGRASVVYRRKGFDYGLLRLG
jgi:ribosomal subunit interface protein